MLDARFLTETLLEIKESIFGPTHTKVNFWYYDLANNLCSYTGCEDDTPTRPMTPEQRAWVDKHMVPLAHRQADEAYVAAQRHAKTQSARRRAEDYCRRIDELNERNRRWEEANPIFDVSHEELNRIELEQDALRDFWKRELKVYNYRGCSDAISNPLTIHNVSRQEAIELIIQTRPLRADKDLHHLCNADLINSSLRDQFLLLNIYTDCPVTGEPGMEFGLDVFQRKLQDASQCMDTVMDWIALAQREGHTTQTVGNFFALAV